MSLSDENASPGYEMFGILRAVDWRYTACVRSGIIIARTFDDGCRHLDGSRSSSRDNNTWGGSARDSSAIVGTRGMQFKDKPAVWHEGKASTSNKL